VCIVDVSEPFGSLLQGGGGSAAPADAGPPPQSSPGLAMRHNSMPHAEPWFHGRISRQKVSRENGRTTEYHDSCIIIYLLHRISRKENVKDTLESIKSIHHLHTITTTWFQK